MLVDVGHGDEADESEEGDGRNAFPGRYRSMVAAGSCRCGSCGGCQRRFLRYRGCSVSCRHQLTGFQLGHPGSQLGVLPFQLTVFLRESVNLLLQAVQVILLLFP